MHFYSILGSFQNIPDYYSRYFGNYLPYASKENNSHFSLILKYLVPNEKLLIPHPRHLQNTTNTFCSPKGVWTPPCAKILTNIKTRFWHEWKSSLFNKKRAFSYSMRRVGSQWLVIRIFRFIQDRNIHPLCTRLSLSAGIFTPCMAPRHSFHVDWLKIAETNGLYGFQGPYTLEHDGGLTPEAGSRAPSSGPPKEEGGGQTSICAKGVCTQTDAGRGWESMELVKISMKETFAWIKPI